MKIVLLSAVVLLYGLYGMAQEADLLLKKVKASIEKVKDYEAAGIMKTNVPFLKVPPANVTVFFKKPGKMKIRNDKGISLVPKGAVSMSLNSLLSGKDFTAIPAGDEVLNGISVKVLKLLPMDAGADIVLSTLYIDAARALIIKAVTTTRESGTYELMMEYGAFAAYSLPSKAVFVFNTREYKLPKGITFDYDDGTRKTKVPENANAGKGRLEITYTSYKVNKGVSDDVFE